VSHTNNTSKNHIEKFIVFDAGSHPISHTFLGVSDIEKKFSGDDTKLTFNENLKVSWADSPFSSTVNINLFLNLNHSLV